ncbi:MAG: hypothetical protein ACYCZW_00455 [Minisyncoccota bacterium]
MIKKIIRKIKNILLSRYSFFPAWGNELKRIKLLRQSVAGINFTGETTSEWLQNQKNLRELILTKDPRDFINWVVILYTMFYDAATVEFDSLRQSPRWDNTYVPHLHEDKIGNPPRYIKSLSSSGNLIHHLYALEQLYSVVPNLHLSTLTSIMEFGGGYGSLCRLCYRLGFQSSYEIFDFKIFQELQKYFVLSTSIAQYFKKIRFIDTSENITSSPDLFISLWSLSESPLALRKEIILKIQFPKYVLIGYQPEFSGIDNIQYFMSLTQNMQQYVWIEKDIPHIPENKYLIGVKKE